ncbi:hypothetical protein [Pseudomonas sp. stari2]|uniref:hypothetical protein n=1 Tax=Pseudomonas sp. Stari2 TaxID=2954814 RepID=UPI00345D60CE
MSLESTERAICAALNAADEKVGMATEACVRAVLEFGANAGIFPVLIDGRSYDVKIEPSHRVGENRMTLETQSYEVKA